MANDAQRTRIRPRRHQIRPPPWREEDNGHETSYGCARHHCRDDVRDLSQRGPPVLATEATDQLRAAIDQMYRLVATGSTAETREAVRKAADRMFDWAAMAEGALGQHWRERTPDERAEFVRLFRDVFERAYLSKIQLADAERFAYLGDTIEGDHTVVRTQITTNNGTVIPVNYRARMTQAERGEYTIWTSAASASSPTTELSSARS